MKEWWVSCPAFTCWVKTKGNWIVGAAPIVKRWIGQSFSRFIAYYDAEKERIK